MNDTLDMVQSMGQIVGVLVIGFLLFNIVQRFNRKK